MKTTTLVLALVASCACAVVGQDSKGGGAELQAPKKAAEEKKAVVTPPTTKTNQVLGAEVSYGGYFADLKRAEKKRPLFNLKTPPDPKKDMENLWYYPGSNTISGVVLFSIKF